MFEFSLVNEKKTKEESADLMYPTNKLGLLKRILDSSGEIVEHVEIKGREAGLEIQVTDSMHVILCNIFLSKKLFDTYRCDRNITIGVKIKTISTILRDISFQPGSTLHFSCEDEPSKLDILFKHPSYTLDWRLDLFSFDTEVFNIPGIEYTSEIRMSKEELTLLPKLVGIFGDFLQIITEQDKVIFAQSGDTNMATMTLEPRDNEIEINVVEPVKKEIAMKYISMIVKVAPLASNIKMYLGEEAPVFFDLTISDVGYIRYYIAPKLESDSF